MKFNKEKIKKFQKGAKASKKAISAAIARDAANTAIKDSVYNSGITAYQSTPVIIQSPRQEVVLKEFEPSTFSQAFKQARKAGLKEFTWNGKRYTTDLKGDTQTKKTIAAKAPVVNNSTVNNPLTEEQLKRNAPQLIQIGNRVNTGLLVGPNRRRVSFSDPQENQQSVNEVNQRNHDFSMSQLRALYQSTRDFLIQDNNERLGIATPGDGLPGYQQGGQLHLRNGWERFFKIEPPYTPVNSEESTTSYMDNPWWGSAEEKRIIRKRTPYADLYSGMIIRNPGTNKADTTFVAPSGKTFKPNDIRSGKAPAGYGYKFFKKPTGYFQQGGVIGSNEEEVVIDFVSRFSQMTGVDPNTEQGQQVLSPVVNLFVEGGYIQQYESMDETGRDQMVQDIVYQMQEGQNQTVEYAKKGAKLKLLRQYK